jgi:endonuclease/exonuclease/phosphatase family metal-dependent hydrolase
MIDIKHQMKVNKISLATFNLKGSPILEKDTYKRIKTLGISLNKKDIDIINLQEVFTYYHLCLLRRKMINFPYCVFEGFIFGPKGGLVTFSKIPIQKSSFVSYPNPKIVKRMFLGKGMLINKIENSAIYVLNTHLTANRDNDWSKTNRFYPTHISQIERLKKVIENINSFKFLIVSGDFNISKNSDLYKKVINKMQLEDVFEEYNFPTFHQEFMSKGEKSNRIDYILIKTKKRWSSTSKGHLFTKAQIARNINKGFLSDHIGLQALLNLES